MYDPIESKVHFISRFFTEKEDAETVYHSR